MAIWTMAPDKIEEEKTQVAKKFGVFWCNANNLLPLRDGRQDADRYGRDGGVLWLHR